jgi:hypothetical protein
VAKSKGKHLGRPFLEKPKNYEMVVEQWKNKEVGTLEASKRLGVSKTTFYQMLKRYAFWCTLSCAKRCTFLYGTEFRVGKEQMIMENYISFFKKVVDIFRKTCYNAKW